MHGKLICAQVGLEGPSPIIGAITRGTIQVKSSELRNECLPVKEIND